MQFYARDIMSRHLIYTRPEMTIEEVKKLFTDCKISGAPVVNDQDELVGVISIHDIVQYDVALPFNADFYSENQALETILGEEGFHFENLEEGFASDFMTQRIITAHGDTPVEELARLMFQNKIHRVIIVQPGTSKPVGLVSTYDLLKLMAEAEPSSELVA